MNDNTNRLALLMTREYLRNAKLCRTLDLLGFDTTNYRLLLMDEMVKMLGNSEPSDEICDLIEEAEVNVLSISVHALNIELESAASALLEKIKNTLIKN